MDPYLQAISTVGFPIALSAFLLVRFDKNVVALTNSIIGLNGVIARLESIIAMQKETIRKQDETIQFMRKHFGSNK